MKFLIDTNIISEVGKVRPNHGVLTWFTGESEESLAISSISFGELNTGIRRLPPGRKRKDLQAWFDRVYDAYSHRALIVDSDTALCWGQLRADALDQGRPLSLADGLIAASALVNELTVVTRNTKDFEGTGVKLFNPWTPG